VVDILQAGGVTFPEGATASFSPVTSEIIVQNLPENIDAVEAFVTPMCCRSPMTLAFSVHVVQADAKTLRDFAAQNRREGDQGAGFRALEDAAMQGRAKFLSSAWFETRSGQRALLTAGTQYTTVAPSEFDAKNPPPPANAPAGGTNPAPKDAASEPKQKAEAPPQIFSAKNHVTPAGLSLEVDPVIGPDGVTIDVSLALQYHYAPPSPHEEKTPADGKVLLAAVPNTDFHVGSVTTATTLTTGSTRLIGLWKPEGAPEFEKADVLQAAFLRVDVLSLTGPR
jgi:hypothetical protein